MDTKNDGTVEVENNSLPFQARPSKKLKKHFPIWLVLGGILLFILGFGASYIVFRFVTGQKPLGGLTDNIPNPISNKPAMTACPLNGVGYAKDKVSWDDRRPLGVMIENHTEARPQSGLGEADVVYEAMAEGGITRFLAVYLCQEADPVGPVRSARTYFLDWISEYDGLYAHVGGAGTPGPADAMGQIQRYGILDLDEFSLGSPTYIRDTAKIRQGIATEHTAYSSTEKLWQVAQEKGWGAVNEETGTRWDAVFDPWQFTNAKPASPSSGTKPQTITIPFWNNGTGDYTVVWTFDPASGTYKRVNGGVRHIDTVTNQQLSAKTIVVQFMIEERADDGYPGNQHLIYGTIGSGDAWIFANGQQIQGKWRKNSRTDRTLFYDAQGNEYSFTPGQIWIEGVPTANKQSIKITP